MAAPVKLITPGFTFSVDISRRHCKQYSYVNILHQHGKNQAVFLCKLSYSLLLLVDGLSVWRICYVLGMPNKLFHSSGDVFVAVLTGDPLACKTQGYVLTTTTSGYIASALTWEKGLGSPECPWRIQASPGQRIKLHLYDFNLEPHMTTPTAVEDCRRYGYIKEHNGELSSTICGTNRRDAHIYTSQSESVDILFLDNAQSPLFFVIKYDGKNSLAHLQ